MRNKLFKFIKLMLLIIFNNIILGMILGFLWYKLGFAKTTINMLSGIETLKIIFVSFKYIYYFMLCFIEFVTIIFFNKVFNNKKTCIIYYILSLIASMLLLFRSSIGFNTGWNIDSFGDSIKIQYIFTACIGLRYSSWLFTLNIPTLLGLILISIRKKQKIDPSQ